MGLTRKIFLKYNKKKLDLRKVSNTNSIKDIKVPMYVNRECKRGSHIFSQKECVFVYFLFRKYINYINDSH